MTIPNLPPEWAILLAFALCVGTLLLGWLKVRLISRALSIRVVRLEKTIIHLAPKAEVDKLCGNLEKLAEISRGHDRDSIHLEEMMRSMQFVRDRVEDFESLKAEFLEKFTLRNDFIREIQSLNSQLYNIFLKIEQVDNRSVVWKGRSDVGHD